MVDVEPDDSNETEPDDSNETEPDDSNETEPDDSNEIAAVETVSSAVRPTGIEREIQRASLHAALDSHPEQARQVWGDETFEAVKADRASPDETFSEG